MFYFKLRNKFLAANVCGFLLYYNWKVNSIRGFIVIDYKVKLLFILWFRGLYIRCFIVIYYKVKLLFYNFYRFF